ncbi:MAG TPA: monovalent cation/H(+) antiporter subunit G [Thermomicrobiales bacterium]|nr:monovalent cation/H(+) antiporter subunit G [Thermomicrobiales bacterium]
MNIAISDIFVIVGLVFMTLGVVGLIRMPDVYTKLHAASKAVFLGIIVLGVAAALVGTAETGMRLILLSVLVLLTTPVSAHAIARAAYVHRNRMATAGALDESGHHLADHDHAEPTWRI